jgi:hypothetical protein
MPRGSTAAGAKQHAEPSEANRYFVEPMMYLQLHKKSSIVLSLAHENPRPMSRTLDRRTQGRLS